MAQATMLSQYEQDPRPDLESDHGWWVALLTAAKTYNEEIFGILHCLRCGGAGLKRNARSGLRILPGEWDAEAYNKFRDKHLRPNTGAIKELLFAASASAPKQQKTIPSLDGWPEQAVVFERRHGYPARLYHFINQMIPTPRGAAKLLQVFQDICTVHVAGDTEVTRYPPEVIIDLLMQNIATSKKEAM